MLNFIYFRKEAELNAIAVRFDEDQSLIARLQRQIKELVEKVQELKEELAAERHARVKADKARNEFQNEVCGKKFA